MTVLNASGFESSTDFAPLHLPMPGLFADLDAGVGAVALTDDFLLAPADLRVGVLQQWLRALTLKREAALVDMFHDFSESLAHMTIVEQIDRFRQRCAALGLDCPLEFPVLLQRY